jgi:hypothetical protein
MRRKFFNLVIIVVLFASSITSCSDVWDSHYSPVFTEKSDLNLYKYIEKDSSLAVFNFMLKMSGYDSILSKNQTYTVWAPVNTAFLGVNFLDSAEISEIVKNHIARFSNPTSDVTSKSVFMLDNKYIDFKRVGTGFTFGGKNLVKSNIATANGILHYIDTYVPYIPNIWEFIGKTENLDSIKNYLYSQSKIQFDAVASGDPIGVDSLTKQLLYDSVFVYKNLILDKIGQLGKEDSIYTAILPTNAAWSEAYNRIKPYFNTLAKNGGVQTQRENTQLAIVQDAIFRKRVSDPGTLDSIVSTTGSVFKSPAGYIFSGTTKNELSNGNAYVTDLLKYKAGDSWQKTIRVEAENEAFGREKSNCDIYSRSSAGSGLNISQEKYIYVNNLTTNNTSLCYVRFPIPNTLSAKYNVYCVFVPTSIESASDLRPSKATFRLQYIDATGNLTAEKLLSVPQNVTDPTKLTKMFVTQIQFPYCNLIDFSSFKTSDITVKLRIDNAVKVSEKDSYNRDMRIDCILLEPVQ